MSSTEGVDVLQSSFESVEDANRSSPCRFFNISKILSASKKNSSVPSESPENFEMIESQKPRNRSGNKLRTDNSTLKFILTDVSAFIDVEGGCTSKYRSLLHKLGASVHSVITESLTHIIFWNGSQQSLGKAQQMISRPFVVSPHWILECYWQKMHANESAYQLYNMAPSIAMNAADCISSTETDRRNESDIVMPSHSRNSTVSGIIHCMERLSDRLAEEIDCCDIDQNLAARILSPIIARFESRLSNLNQSKSAIPSSRTAVGDKSGDIDRALIEQCDVLREPTDRPFASNTITRVDSSSSDITLALSELCMENHQTSNSDSECSHRSYNFTDDESNFSELSERSTRRIIEAPNSDHDRSVEIESVSSVEEFMLKSRPIIVCTRSKVLNDLQNVRSSEEFVRCEQKKKIRWFGNIAVSGIEELECQTLLAITKRLGVLKIKDRVNRQTRYVIGDSAGSVTDNLINALAAHIPIVSVNWAYESLGAGVWLNGCKYVLPRWKFVCRSGRTRGKIKLFSKLGQFFISHQCCVRVNKLQYLISSFGGKVSDSLRYAHIVVAPQMDWHFYACRRRSDGLLIPVVTEKWIFDCISGFIILPFG